MKTKVKIPRTLSIWIVGVMSRNRGGISAAFFNRIRQSTGKASAIANNSFNKGMDIKMN